MKIRCMGIAWLIHRATNSQNMSFLVHCNNGCTNVPQSYVIHTFSLLLKNGIHRPESKMKYTLTCVIDCGCSSPNMNLHNTCHYTKGRLQTQETLQSNPQILLQLLRIIINRIKRDKICKICNCPPQMSYTLLLGLEMHCCI
jgi:hypothetical protein